MSNPNPNTTDDRGRHVTPTETDHLAPDPARFQTRAKPAAERSVGQVVGAGFTLLILLVGVPVGLWLLTGPPPVPTGLPSRSDLTQPIAVEAILVVLLLVVWLAWLQFAACVLVEIVSLFRGRGLPRPVPLSGRSQQFARTLVSALLVGGVAFAVDEEGDVGESGDGDNLHHRLGRGTRRRRASG